jgi:hypothetical protein
MSTPHDAWEAIYYHERSRRESHGPALAPASTATVLHSDEDEDLLLERLSIRKSALNKEELFASHDLEEFPLTASFSPPPSESGIGLDTPVSVGCDEDALRSPISPLLPAVIINNDSETHVLHDEILKQRQVCSLSVSHSVS